MSASFAELERILDGLLDVIVTAKRSNDYAVVRVAVAARREARRAADAALLGDPASVAQHAALLRGLQSRLEGSIYSVAAARRETAQADEDCVRWLAARFGDYRAARVAALSKGLATLRQIERSRAFQRALLLDQLRMTDHERDSLTYGTTPFASMAHVFAHPACESARRLCYDNEPPCRTVLVVGSSSGSLCLFAAALGFRAVGVEVVPTLAAVATKLATQFPDIGMRPDNFVCADARDATTLAPLVQNAGLVILTSTCWTEDVLAAVFAVLASHLRNDAVLIDYAANPHPSLSLLGQTTVPVSWSPDDGVPIHLSAAV